MKSAVRWLARVLVLLALAAGIGWLTLGDRITRLMAVNSLFAPDRIVANFSHMDALFDHVPMPAPVHEPSPLPRAKTPVEMPEGFADWVADRSVTSALVLRGGEVVFEQYYLGTGPDDLRVSWSMAKSFLGTLTGLSVENGEIASLDDPADHYAPVLTGSAYEGVTIRQLLTMTSGVEFSEDYHDFWSDINRMGRRLALGGSLDSFTAGFDTRWAEPGTSYNYVSINTHALGMVLRGATGKTIPALMNERLFTPLKLEVDPVFLTDSAGNAFVLGGLTMTTRDYARFGQMLLAGGVVDGTRLVSEAWIAEMSTPSAPYGPAHDAGGGYGYQWRIPPDPKPGEFFARGVYGQYIWIDQSADVVVVITAADRGFNGENGKPASEAMIRAIVETVQ